MNSLSGKEMIARVLPDISLDQDYEYIIPKNLESKVKPGARVVIPFGKRQIKGYVIAVGQEAVYERSKLKPIAAVEGQFIAENLMRLGHWIADYYCASLIQTIRSILPASVRNDKIRQKTSHIYRLADSLEAEKLVDRYSQNATKKAQLLVLKVLLVHKEGTAAFLTQTAGVSQSPIKSLLADGVLIVEEIEVDRDPFGGEKIVRSQPLDLTDEQSEAMKTILKCLETQEKQVVLLQGVTGCGKTEIYLQAIQHCLEQQKQAIVLVPEISLTPQTNQRFRARFGDQVSVLHSRLSDGERYDQWMKIKAGKTSIVVGARSALFAPFDNLGLIVVDEEHEPSYKQDKAPRYNARDVAVVRAALDKCTVILGSATPSLESLSNAKKHKYKHCILKSRADNAVMPTMKLVDMRNESSNTGSVQIFSKELVEAIKVRLSQKMQTILFLNRRGFATQMQCLKCGFVAKCTECTSTYTYHRKVSTLTCHFCGVVNLALESCPQCGDKNIRYTGLGTEKIESLCQSLFPYARIARMDSDTMTRKDDHKNTLEAFQAGDYDILVGTQMIAKGLHFPKVTLVGVIFADLGLYIPDFRAAERTYQLITQVAGRAGRGALAGEVLVQSYTPFHPALQHALYGSVDDFYEGEIIGRQILNFPPYKQLILIHLKSLNEDLVRDVADQLQKKLAGYLDAESDQLMPAVPCSVARIKGYYRFQISFLTSKIWRTNKILRRLVLEEQFPKGVEVFVDVDAQSLS